MFETITWKSGDRPYLQLIDQTRLPAEETYLRITTVDQLIAAIQSLAVRGAPALGAAGAYGVAVAMLEGADNHWTTDQLNAHIDRIRDARPTAVNLAWGVNEVRPFIDSGIEAVLAHADAVAHDDEKANKELSRLGADWIQSHIDKPTLRALTHCNTGALATTAWGTALGVLHELHDRGVLEFVYADETRPLLQGSRLTSWELHHLGIDHAVQADGAAASTILRGLVDFAIIGADRITVNGDTANKIGSLGVALACHRAGIPFLVAAPVSTIDPTTASGDGIVIEERDDHEVLEFAGHRVTPAQAHGYNPAFDVTPHDLIAAIFTERGVAEPATDTTGKVMSPLLPATTSTTPSTVKDPS